MELGRGKIIEGGGKDTSEGNENLKLQEFERDRRRKCVKKDKRTQRELGRDM